MLVVSQLRICRPPLISSHLDMKDVQCAKKNDGREVSYHIITHLGATAAQTAPQTFYFLQQWQNLGSIGIDFALISCTNNFSCTILSFWDMIDFVFCLSGLYRNVKNFFFFGGGLFFPLECSETYAKTSSLR